MSHSYAIDFDSLKISYPRQFSQTTTHTIIISNLTITLKIILLIRNIEINDYDSNIFFIHSTAFPSSISFIH